MLKLKLQNSGHLMRRANSLEKTLMPGKIKGERRRGQKRMRWFNSINDSQDTNLGKLLEILEGRGAWLVSGHEVANSQTWVSHWTTTAISLCITFTFSHANSVFSPCLILLLTLKSLQNLCICDTFIFFASLPSATPLIHSAASQVHHWFSRPHCAADS